MTPQGLIIRISPFLRELTNSSTFQADAGSCIAERLMPKLLSRYNPLNVVLSVLALLEPRCPIVSHSLFLEPPSVPVALSPLQHQLPLVDQVLVHPESTASSPASATTPASSSTASSAAGSLVAKGGVAAIMVIMVAGFLAIDIVEKSRNGRKVFMRCHSFLEIQSFIPQFFI